MKERPIIFSADMVRAILDGRKTQTRRAVKPQLPSDFSFAKFLADGRAVFDVGNGWGVEYVNCPYGAIGDRLWVREKWRVVGWDDGGPYTIEYADGSTMQEKENFDYDYEKYMRYYEQSDKECTDAGLELDENDCYILKDGVVPTRWRSPIHMPHWASRITLEITDIRVERVQEISERDAGKEGIQDIYVPGVVYIGNGETVPKATEATDVETYQYLWDSLNAKRGYPWSSNPWVWVIEFERLPQSPHEGLAQ